MKRFFISYLTSLSLIGAMVVFSLSSASAQAQRRERNVSERAVRQEKVQTLSQPMRIKGGTNGDRQLYGVVCPSDYGPAESGVAEIKSEGQFSWIHKFDSPVFSGCYMGDSLFIVHYDAAEPKTVTYAFYKKDTYELIRQQAYTLNSPDILPYGLTYDHTTNKVYGSFFADANKWMITDEAQFGYLTGDILDPVKIIGTLPTRMRAMATDKNGQIYAYGFDGNLYTINKFTAEAKVIKGITLITTDEEADVTSPWGTYGRESMVIDWETDDFYYAYGDDMDNTFIGKFNTASNAIELLSDFGYYGSEVYAVFTSLYFETEFNQGGAKPLPVTNLSVIPVGVELKATVKFTMPTLDTEENALSGSLTWKISNGVSELASGSADPGAEVSTTVTLADEGEKSFVITTSAGTQESNAVMQTKFIGCDTPVIYRKPTVRVNGAEATIKWEAATPEHGGNLAPVTYKIVRMPDNHIVAEACSETQIVDEVTSQYKEFYTYDVYPVSGTKTGECVSSRGDYIGKYLKLPLFEDFDNEIMFLQYPVIDNNHDENIWEINLEKTAAVYAGNSNDADDWLLIGPFKMTKGNKYSFRMTAAGHNIKETVAVYVGAAADEGVAFNTELVPPTDIFPMEGMLNVNEIYDATADGDYYFGIKACSEKNSQFLYINDVAVNEISGKHPAAPSDFRIEPALTSATLSFTMPTKSVDGSAVDGLKEARIYRDNVLIATITEDVAPGVVISYTDSETVSDGDHLYAVSAVNGEGESALAEMTQYRGLDMPGSPTNLRFYEDLNTPGLIHISFDAPERGYHGGYINKDELGYILDYMVMGAGAGEPDLGAGTTHTFQLPFAVTAQKLFSGSIYARNSKGSVRASWTTNICTIGAALEMPIHESWAGMSQKSGIWAGQNIDENAELFESTWDIIDGGTSTAKPQDKDGGMMALSTSKDNGGRRLLSPRFSVKDTQKPTLVFYYYHTADARNFDLEVIVEDQPVKVLQNIELAATDQGKWVRCEVALNEFADKKYIQLAFTGRGAVAQDFIAIDNVTISDFVDKDLAVVDFAAPTKCDVNEKIALTLKIRNNGSSQIAASDYKVTLYKNDAVLDTKDGVAISADSETEVRFNDTPAVTDPANITYYATIDYAADSKKDNNESRRLTVRMVIADYPTVTDLKGESLNGVTLTWSDPDMSDIPGNATVESFENYEAFIIKNIGDWTLYDRDNKATAIMALTTGVLDYPNIGEKMAWQVIDPIEAGIPLAAWTPRTGSKFLVSFQACIDGYRDINSDDWLVSPELNASAQTISFYARTATSQYSPEIFDFMVSSTGNNVGDFKAMASNVEVPYTSGDEWTEFSYKVPEGTRYFAIVHKSNNQFAMIVDDITFIKAGSAPVSLELQGFNIYRDGKRINGEPVGDNRYSDTSAEKGKEYSYAVSAVWNKGEAALSNVVKVVAAEVTAVGRVEYDIIVSGNNGIITIDGAHNNDVAIFTVDGICVARLKAEERTEIAVPCSGVYIIKVGNAVAKVAVR